MIEVSRLTKRYGTRTAVEDLSFTVDSGLVYGFLGPNGAGKTTTMNILTGCLAATEGRVTVGGFDIFDQPIQAKRLVGYLPEQPPLYTGMTVEEYLSFVARAKGVPFRELDGQLSQAEAVTGVTDVAKRLIRNLSTASGWASPRPCWASPRSSSWTSPRWGWTRCRSWRSAS